MSMLRAMLLCLLALGASVVLSATPLFAADPVLWYQHPAQRWGDALPVGNGRLGGMVFGGIATERIQLNEDTIWNGKKGGIASIPMR